jgi:hypothetical protein
LLIGKRRVLVDAEGDGDELTGLKISSGGDGFDGFSFGMALGGSGADYDNKKRDEQETTEANREATHALSEILDVRHFDSSMGVLPGPIGTGRPENTSIVANTLMVNFYWGAGEVNG